MRRAIVLMMVSAAFGLPGLSAQAPAPPQPRIWQGVYTTAQAERGRATFLVSCQRCHNADLSGDRGPALRGERFTSTWGDGSVANLFAKIRDTMPPFATSTIDEGAKLDIVAFILQTNGFPAADRELAFGELEAIQIVAAGRPAAVQNFARVQVVGCLAPGEANRFVLTSASEPVAATDGAGTGAAAALGSGRVVLLNASPFEPVRQVGQKVEARGILYRDERDTLVTVTALSALGACGN